jgi:glycosyltransferase involved in cell wall biosynthesis
VLWDSGNVWSSLRSNVRRSRAIRAAIRTFAPDVVVSFIDQTNIRVLVATLGSTLPVIVSERIDPRRHDIGSAWNLARRCVYPLARRLVVQSEAVAPWANTIVRPRQVRVLPNFVRELPPPVLSGRSKLDVVAMGRLDRQKGFDLLLRAFHRAKLADRGARLVILGDGREREGLAALSAELGLQGHLEMPGVVSAPEEWLTHAAVFVLSSRYEGFPNALLEAMALGCAVIATDCDSGPADIVRHEVDGLLVPVDDVDAMAAALTRLMDDEQLRQRLSAAAPGVRSRFSRNAIVDRWEDLIEEVAPKRAVPASQAAVRGAEDAATNRRIAGQRGAAAQQTAGDQSHGRPHVLFLLPSLAAGGAERVMLTLLRHFDRSKFTVELAVLTARGAQMIDDLPSGVVVHDLHCSRVRVALAPIARLIWRRRPAVVFSTLGHLNLALAIIRAFLPASTRLIARETVVISENLEATGRPWLWRFLYRAFYPRFDAVVCQSEDMRSDLVDRYRLPATRATVIHNPVDAERVRALAAGGEAAASHWPALTGGPRLLAAGRLVRQKGFDLLIEALADERHAKATLVVLGDGPLRAELERRAASNGVSDRLVFVGHQRNPFPFFAAADAFVLSSRFEGFPNVVLEALACATPVIATPAPGGVREILDPIPECVVAADISARALADAIARWQAGPMSRVPPARLHRFDATTITRRYEMLFERHAATTSPQGARA